MLLEAKLLLDEVATEVMQDMGEYGRIWVDMGKTQTIRKK